MSRSCPYCGGYGKLILDPYGSTERVFVCPRCRGTGSSRVARKYSPTDPVPPVTERNRFYLKYANKPCGYCKKPMIFPTRDHAFIPKHKGGKLNKANVVVCCRPCNSDKGGLTLQEWYELLLKHGDERAIFVERIVFGGNNEQSIHGDG